MNERIEILEQDKSRRMDDFYQAFKEKLVDTHTFPSDYLFKFIVSSEQQNIARLHAIFENANAAFSIRDSKNGKYSSVTIKASVNDVEDVVIYYRQAASIEGVVML